MIKNFNLYVPWKDTKHAAMENKRINYDPSETLAPAIPKSANRQTYTYYKHITYVFLCLQICHGEPKCAKRVKVTFVAKQAKPTQSCANYAMFLLAV